MLECPQAILTDTVDSQLAKNLEVMTNMIEGITNIMTIVTMTIIISFIMIMTQVRKKSRQDLLAKKEALDLDLASQTLNNNSVLMIMMVMVIMIVMMIMMVVMMMMQLIFMSLINA